LPLFKRRHFCLPLFKGKHLEHSKDWDIGSMHISPMGIEDVSLGNCPCIWVQGLCTRLFAFIIKTPSTVPDGTLQVETREITGWSRYQHLVPVIGGIYGIVDTYQKDRYWYQVPGMIPPVDLPGTMTRIEWDQQYKQQVCTDKTIKNKGWTELQQSNDNDSETSSWKHQETSRRELVDKSSTALCASKHIHGIPGSGILSQLLVTWKYAKTGLENWIVSAKQVKTNGELVWAQSYSWSPDLDQFPVDIPLETS